MTNKLSWGIIGAGHIASEFADGVIASETGRLHAVASRNIHSAQKFANQFGGLKAYAGYQSLLDDKDVDAVYIATPHPMHAEWAIKAAEAGKHLLVEKPIGMNYSEAMAIVDAARVHDVFLMEAFMYRCHPQTRRVWELIASGAIGRVGLIVAAFGYHGGMDPTTRAYANELGGGGILDVGCYPISMARLVAGAVIGKPFSDPKRVDGRGHLGPTGVDHWAAATLEFDNDLIAQIATGTGMDLDNTVRIFGESGNITVRDPWIPSRFDRNDRIIELRRAGKPMEPITVVAPLDLYTYEADEVGRNIVRRQAPAMSFDDTLGNMRTLDRWRQSIGLVYEMEKHTNAKPTGIAGRTPARREPVRMKYDRITGIDKPISRLVFGCDSNHTWPDTMVMLDDFFSNGGNTFDTSSTYGWPKGNCERNLGAWIHSRGLRNQVVIIEKGANAPNDHGSGLTLELTIGLERLGVDCVDIYMIHRDNEQVPVGEWCDALNENFRAGRMKTFGLSNFTTHRLDAFAAYAKANGLMSFSMVSNQFSLAHVRGRVWEDCYLVSASDVPSREWFERTKTPLMPWSSQARGFFTPAAVPENRSNDEWNRCWYSDDNFERKRRAIELARQKNVEPINIALAYVLHQSFPTFPLVGPKALWETRSTLRALDISLSDQETRWLDLQEESPGPIR